MTAGFQIDDGGFAHEVESEFFRHGRVCSRDF